MIIWGELGAQKLDSDGVHFLEFQRDYVPTDNLDLRLLASRR